LLQSERDTALNAGRPASFVLVEVDRSTHSGDCWAPVPMATFTTLIDESFLAGKRSHDDAAAT
jgi:hypothetical protein